MKQIGKYMGLKFRRKFQIGVINLGFIDIQIVDRFIGIDEFNQGKSFEKTFRFMVFKD